MSRTPADGKPARYITRIMQSMVRVGDAGTVSLTLTADGTFRAIALPTLDHARALAFESARKARPESVSLASITAEAERCRWAPLAEGKGRTATAALDALADALAARSSGRATP